MAPFPGHMMCRQCLPSRRDMLGGVFFSDDSCSSSSTARLLPGQYLGRPCIGLHVVQVHLGTSSVLDVGAPIRHCRGTSSEARTVVVLDLQACTPVVHCWPKCTTVVPALRCIATMFLSHRPCFAGCTTGQKHHHDANVKSLLGKGHRTMAPLPGPMMCRQGSLPSQ